MDDLERQLLTTWSELARRQAEADQRAREAHTPQQPSIPGELRAAAEKAKRRQMRREVEAEVARPLIGEQHILTDLERRAVWLIEGFRYRPARGK